MGTLSITAVDITNGSQLPAMPVKHLDMAAGIAVTDFFALDNFDSINPNKTVLVAEVRDSNEAVHSNHVIALAPPANWEIQKATVNITSVNPSSNGASIVLKTNHVALYVTLTTLATGRFSTNAFIALPGESMTVQFIPFNGQKVILAWRLCVLSSRCSSCVETDVLFSPHVTSGGYGLAEVIAACRASRVLPCIRPMFIVSRK